MTTTNSQLFKNYSYARADVTFARLGFFARIRVLLTGKVNQKAIQRFRLTTFSVFASDCASAQLEGHNKTWELSLNSDLTVDKAMEPGAGDNWGRAI